MSDGPLAIRDRLVMWANARDRRNPDGHRIAEFVPSNGRYETPRDIAREALGEGDDGC